MRGIRHAVTAIVVTVLKSSPLPGQEPCATVLSENARQYMQAFAQSGQQVPPRPANMPVVNMPVQIHIIRTSGGTGGLLATYIPIQMNLLNQAYQQFGWQFFHVEPIDYINNDTYYNTFHSSVVRNQVRQVNNNPNAINVYFAPWSGGSAESSWPRDLQQGICFSNGYASNPNVYGSTFSHEMGHYFWLFHTHEPALGRECPDGSNCLADGDQICDTPADPQLGALNTTPYPDCNYFGTAMAQPPCPLQPYQPDPHNFMSYAPFQCRDVFTSDQVDRAWATLIFEESRTVLMPAPLVRHVPSTYSTIQAAIDAAGLTDVVEVGPGTYSGNINFNGKLIVLRSTNGPQATRIQCSGTRGITIDRGETREAIVDGFLIEGGSASLGAGMFIGSSPTIKNCVFQNCTATGDGGAIYIERSYLDAEPRIENCEFRNCQSGYWGGAILIGANANAEIVNNLFIGNTAGGPGGAIYMNNLALAGTLIEGNVFSHNTAGGTLGGSAISGHSAMLECNTFFSNSSSGTFASVLRIQPIGVTTVAQQIFAENNSPAVQVDGLQSTATFECNDFFWNTGGSFNLDNSSWQQTDLSSTNIFANPQMCWAEEEGFELRSHSPCLPANFPPALATCGGVIGAPGGGCATACPVALTGDVNLSGGVATSDIIHLVNYVFKNGVAPLPCAAAGDVNCTVSINSADIIYLVDYVLKAGASPCEVCTKIAQGFWTCP